MSDESAAPAWTKHGEPDRVWAARVTLDGPQAIITVTITTTEQSRLALDVDDLDRLQRELSWARSKIVPWPQAGYPDHEPPA